MLAPAGVEAECRPGRGRTGAGIGDGRGPGALARRVEHRDLVAGHEHHLDDGHEGEEHQREPQGQLDGGLALVAAWRVIRSGT